MTVTGVGPREGTGTPLVQEAAEASGPPVSPKGGDIAKSVPPVLVSADTSTHNPVSAKDTPMSAHKTVMPLSHPTRDRKAPKRLIESL